MRFNKIALILLAATLVGHCESPSESEVRDTTKVDAGFESIVKEHLKTLDDTVSKTHNKVINIKNDISKLNTFILLIALAFLLYIGIGFVFLYYSRPKNPIYWGKFKEVSQDISTLRTDVSRLEGLNRRIHENLLNTYEVVKLLSEIQLSQNPEMNIKRDISLRREEQTHQTPPSELKVPVNYDPGHDCFVKSARSDVFVMDISGNSANLYLQPAMSQKSGHYDNTIGQFFRIDKTNDPSISGYRVKKPATLKWNRENETGTLVDNGEGIVEKREN